MNPTRDDLALYVMGAFEGDVDELEAAIERDPAVRTMLAEEADLELSLRRAAERAVFCPSCDELVRASRCEACGVARCPGGYVVERVLVANAHGRMYLARDADGTRVALKELAFVQAPGRDALAAFDREVTFLRALEHPAIPRFVAAFHEGEGVATRYYLAQQLVEGVSLDRELAHHFYGEREILDIARQVLRVLVYLQGLSPIVIHRDIKPANLIKRPDGSIAVVDFGAAHVHGATSGTSTVGTFGYMPVEQLAGEVDATTDVYALGASLVQLLTRQEPWRVLRADAIATLNVRAPVRAFLLRLVAADRRDRFTNAADALAALERLADATAVPRRSRLPWRTVLAVASAALVLGGVGLAGYRHGREHPTSSQNVTATIGPVETPPFSDSVDTLDSIRDPRPNVPRAEPGDVVFYDVAVDVAAGKVEGPPSAVVTMVLAQDFACPYTARLRSTLAELRAKYPDDLRIVYSDLIIHGQVLGHTHEAACAAGKQGKYREYQDIVWGQAFEAYRGSRRTDLYLDDNLVKIAEAVGLDIARFTTDMRGDCARIVAHDAVQLRDAGVVSTPTMLINGRVLKGAVPIDRIEEVMRVELSSPSRGTGTVSVKGVENGRQQGVLLIDGVVREAVRRSAAPGTPTLGPRLRLSREQLVDAEFSDQPLPHAIGTLASTCGIRFVLPLVHVQRRVSMTARDVRCDHALESLLRAHDLWYELTPPFLIRITPISELDRVGVSRCTGDPLPEDHGVPWSLSTQTAGDMIRSIAAIQGLVLDARKDSRWYVSTYLEGVGWKDGLLTTLSAVGLDCHYDAKTRTLRVAPSDESDHRATIRLRAAD